MTPPHPLNAYFVYEDSTGIILKTANARTPPPAPAGYTTVAGACNMATQRYNTSSGALEPAPTLSLVFPATLLVPGTLLITVSVVSTIHVYSQGTLLASFLAVPTGTFSVNFQDVGTFTITSEARGYQPSSGTLTTLPGGVAISPASPTVPPLFSVLLSEAKSVDAMSSIGLTNLQAKVSALTRSYIRLIRATSRLTD